VVTIHIIGMDKVPVICGMGTCESGGPHIQRILQCIVDSVKLDSIILTESSILDPSYEIWE